MIRIDEIYNHTIWPWIRNNRPGTRMFFCDPFGHTGPEHLYNFGDDAQTEQQYVFMHDQEPIQLDSHRHLFQEVVKRNTDISWPKVTPGSVVVSEQGECVCSNLNLFTVGIADTTFSMDGLVWTGIVDTIVRSFFLVSMNVSCPLVAS